MTILDKFISFANALPANQLSGVENALAEIMESYSDLYVFTNVEQQVIDQRVAEIKPIYAPPDHIAEMFGKPFSA